MAESPAPQTITRLLHAVREGRDGASDELVPLVYAELYGLAHRAFGREHGHHTLQPTALVNEAWLKLAGHLERREDAITDRRHFFILASRVLRQVLFDHARAAQRRKRGDGNRRVTLDLDMGARGEEGFDLVDLEDALRQLETLNERHARVVELRLLAGLTLAETAEALGVSRTTVDGDWFTAKTWLWTRLSTER